MMLFNNKILLRIQVYGAITAGQLFELYLSLCHCVVTVTLYLCDCCCADGLVLSSSSRLCSYLESLCCVLSWME